jgi:hypothetical protein
MYRYQPPKSSIWGHSLRNMKPARQRALFDEFLKKAVAEYSWFGGSLTLFVGSAPAFTPPEAQGEWGHVTSNDVQRFQQLLGAGDRAFYSLSPQQCETALEEIIRNSALAPGVMLVQSVDVSKWLIEGQPAATQSRFILYYGMKPCLSTHLQFQTTDEFEFIKRVLSDLKFCKLNEKHLKPMKRGSKKKRGKTLMIEPPCRRHAIGASPAGMRSWPKAIPTVA